MIFHAFMDKLNQDGILNFIKYRITDFKKDPKTMVAD